MGEAIWVMPEKPFTGGPLTLWVDLDKVKLPEAVSVFQKDGAKVFESTLKPQSEHKAMIQFALYQPGEYKAVLSSYTYSFHVVQQSTVPFFVEVGIVCSSVIIFLGGLFLWAQKKKTAI